MTGRSDDAGIDLAALLRAGSPAGYLETVGEVFATFDEQDSMCLSYGVAAGGRRWFVKVALTPDTATGLRRAAAFHAAVRHPVIVGPVAAADLGDRMALRYPWHPGRVLYHATLRHHGGRAAPGSPLSVFRAQPLPLVSRAVDAILDAHLAVSTARFVAVDLYDGAMLYDAATATMRLIDLDEYRPGPFTVEGDRLPGSRRFMSPEELTHGAIVDDRTTVFVLGRVARTLMDATDDESGWRGTSAQLAVVARATRPVPDDRFTSVADLVAAWRAVTPARLDTAEV
jgi:hypothetical protein